MKWLSDNRYSVVFGSWVASMGIALGLVGRNPYLTGQQKLVQARVYAQGLTIAVVIISLAFETNDSSKGKGRWETIKIIDPNDPEHKHVIEKQIHHEAFAGEDQWRDMVQAEENRLKEKEEHKNHPLHPEKKEKSAKSKNGNGNGNGNGEKKEQKSDSKMKSRRRRNRNQTQKMKSRRRRNRNQTQKMKSRRSQGSLRSRTRSKLSRQCIGQTTAFNALERCNRAARAYSTTSTALGCI